MGHRYFSHVMIAYFVGLLGAFLANLFGITINGVKGQPALLYIVPAILITFVVEARFRGQLDMFWTTPLTEIDTESES